MLHISPHVFNVFLSLMKDHSIFSNNLNVLQMPVKVQLAITFYHMGHYGNGASINDIAQISGCCEGSVKNYMEHCLKAIKSLQSILVQKLMPEEKEIENR